MKNVFVLLVLIFSFSGISAQNTNAITGSLDQGSIESQYDFLVKKSNSFQVYKVVRKDFLGKFFKNVSDSLNVNNREIAKLNDNIYVQNNNVDSLRSQVMTLNRELEQVNKEKNSFSLFGILMGKVAYNTMLWSIILGLLGGMLFFMYRFRSSHVITAKAKDNLAKTKEEFDTFRKKTLEKEQKLMRKLQDELNKNQMNLG